MAIRNLLVLATAGLCIFCSCSNDGQNNGDSGMDDGQGEDSGDMLPDEDDEITRTLITGTDGFCRTEGAVPVSCAEDIDCAGIRKPVGVSCSHDAYRVTDVGCQFVARAELPATDECGADEFCKGVPRKCVDNKCSYHQPNSQCDSDQDCKLEDYGCACLAMNTNVVDYQPAFGEDCTGKTACPQDASTACIDGTCRLVGEFMDSTIRYYCERISECGFSTMSTDDCIAELTANNYEMAAKDWPIIQSTAVATECLGLYNGPWNELFGCIS